MKKVRQWPLAIFYFLLFGLLSIGFLKIDPSPFELAKESFANFWALIICLGCIFGAFVIGIQQVIEQIYLWLNQNKLEKE